MNIIRLVATVLVIAAMTFVVGAEQTASSPKLTSPKGRLVHLDAKRCRPVSARERKWLTDEWTEFQSFAIACPVALARGKTALYVMSVDGYELEKTLPKDAAAPRLPRAIIVAPDGAHLGLLPYAFPFDPPVSLSVTFADWLKNFPRTVELFLRDPAVGGDKTLPSLKWNESLKRYIDTPFAK
jgi:hypothetical protein